MRCSHLLALLLFCISSAHGISAAAESEEQPTLNATESLPADHSGGEQHRRIVIAPSLISIPIAERLQSLRDREDNLTVWPEESAVSVNPKEIFDRVDKAFEALSRDNDTKEAAAGEAADAAAQVTASLIEEPVSDPLDDALLLPHPDALDYVFLEARNAFSQGRLSDLEEILPLLSGHELSAYPELWRLILLLKAQPDDPAVNLEFEHFFALHRDEYIAENALHEYLKIEAERLSAESFLKLYSQLVWNQDDPDLRAWNAIHRLESAAGKNAREEELSAAKLLYRDSGSLAKESYQRLGDAIAGEDRSWLWTRVVVLLQKSGTGKEIKRVLAELPRPELPASIRELHEILDRPNAWLRRQKKLERVPARLAVFASLRLSRTDPAAAARLAEAAVDPKAGSFWKSLVWSRIGFTAMSRLDPRALGWFARAGSDLSRMPYAVSSPEQLKAWRARAELRAGNWYSLGKAIDAMNEASRSEEVWTYWKGRSYAARGLSDLARTEYEKIANRITFYGKLSADALGRPYAFSHPPKEMPKASEIAQWGKNPSIRRAEVLYRMQLYREGHREWNWAMRGISPYESIALAAYARQERLVHRMINTSMKSGTALVVVEQRFPRPHAELIERVSNAQELPSSWVYGLIRQESRFIPAVSSSVGARGLMQLMPGTASWTARQLGIEHYDEGRTLTELEMNLVLGSAYLHMLYADSGESFILATAAYNAGPRRARIWRNTLSDAMEAAVFIETIPYFETREYVKNVLANMQTYSMLTGEPIKNFTGFLGKVTPSLAEAKDLP